MYGIPRSKYEPKYDLEDSQKKCLITWNFLDTGHLAYSACFPLHSLLLPSQPPGTKYRAQLGCFHGQGLYVASLSFCLFLFSAGPQ